MIHKQKIPSVTTACVRPGDIKLTTDQMIESVPLSFLRDNFRTGSFREVRLDSGETEGPFYRVGSTEDFEQTSTPEDAQETGHFCGFRMPQSPLDAKQSWAIANHWGNNAGFCLMFYVQARKSPTSIFCGIPHYLLPGTADKFVEGTEVVANLNNNAAFGIVKIRTWKWNKQNCAWEEIWSLGS